MFERSSSFIDEICVSIVMRLFYLFIYHISRTKCDK